MTDYITILRKSYAMLATNIEASSMVGNMFQDGVITASEMSRIQARGSRTDQNSALLHWMFSNAHPNRGVSFVNALKKAGLSYVLDLLGIPSSSLPAVSKGVATSSYQQPEQPEQLETSRFGKLIETVKNLAPFEEQAGRHGKVYQTSAHLFYGKLPTSKFGANELPSLYAVEALGKSIGDVSTWPGALKQQELIDGLEIYRQELAEVEELLKQLELGGLHILIKLPTGNLIRLLRKCKSNYHSFQKKDGPETKKSATEAAVLEITVKTVESTMMSRADRSVLAGLVHLLCLSVNPTFIFRKKNPGNPNCYLLFNANKVLDESANTVIASEKDYKVVMDAIVRDETDNIQEAAPAPCLWAEESEDED